MSTITYPASERQMAFVSDLLRTREYDANDPFIAYAVEEHAANALSKSDASSLIDMLIKAPKRKGGRTAIQEILATVPKSKYAIPAELLAGTDFSITNDLLFVEVKEYMNNLYARQLHGAPGRFNRSRIDNAALKVIIGIIATDPYKFAKLFGDHYACCGSCGAELTDQRSRELMLGPECRKKFGF
jgi:hypothetical protein